MLFKISEVSYQVWTSNAEMIEHGPCLSQTGLRNEIEKCQETLNDDIKENSDADQDTRCG